MAEFSGLRSSVCVTTTKIVREASFFDVVAAQLTPKVVPTYLIFLVPNYLSAYLPSFVYLFSSVRCFSTKMVTNNFFRII